MASQLPHDSDRRVTLVRITKDGAKTVETLVALAKDHEQHVLAPFGLARAEELKKTLRQMIDLHVKHVAEADLAAEALGK